MIVSASRRTDIPNYYADWFFERIKEGFCYVRNPMNPHQVSEIPLTPEVVDCIVFWTKNPEPMLARLAELQEYSYYFQFTLTGYGKDIEPGVPHKKERMLAVFKELSEKIGPERVIWRYDPIFFHDVYTPDYHERAFSQIAEELSGYTKKCVISFVDYYAKNRKNLQELGIREPKQEELRQFAKNLSRIAKENGMRIASCAEEIDLSDCGIEKNSCIDKELIEKLTGGRILAGKDKNQRTACGCVESVDIGSYHTCLNGCKYCYANYSRENAWKNHEKYDMFSPLLCDFLKKQDRITKRKVKSLRDGQLRME